MKIKPFFYTFLVASAATFVIIKRSSRLLLYYEKSTGRLVINQKHRMKCCSMLSIEKIVLNINGEDFNTLYFKPGEKVFDGPVIIDLPEAEAGDYIKVKLTTRCSRQFTNRGSLEL
jgi:hypothetical protein